MDKLVVYNDLRRLFAISLSYVVIAVCILWLGFTQGSGAVVWPIVSVLVAACFLAGVAFNVRKMTSRNPLFEYTLDGVTDMTKPDDIIYLPWSQVLNVNLKAASNNDLMLEVMGYKTADQFETVTPEMKQQMEANHSDRVYFVLQLSGLWVRQSRMKGAYEWICDHVAEAYPAIAFSRFEDPLSKLGKKSDQ